MPSVTCAPSTPSTVPPDCGRADSPAETRVTARLILAVDQGTTSSRALLFDGQGRALAMAQQEFTQHFPQPGWVEHDALEIWSSQQGTILEVLSRAGATPADVAAVGITNQ